MASLGPLVAYLPTPRNDKGTLQVPVLQELAHAALIAGASSLAVLGSTGAAAYMPRSMRKRVVSAAAEVVDGSVPLLAGAGALTTAEAQINVAEAADAGANIALVAPHSYEPLTDREVYELYVDITGQKILPVCVYHNPRTTRHRFSTTEINRLAQLPGIVAFKDITNGSSLIGRRITEIQAGLTQKQIKSIDWGFSGDRYGAAILKAGANTWHSGLAGVLPEPFVRLANLAKDPQRGAETMLVTRALTPLSVIATGYGTVRVAHAIAQISGVNIGVLPQPLQPLADDLTKLIEVTLGIMETQLSQSQQPYRPRRVVRKF